MSFIVDLPPEVETRLQQEASRQGVPAADVALRFIERGIESELINNPNDLPYAEWKKRYDSIVNRTADPAAPVLTPEMMRRVNLHDEAEDE